MAENSFEQSRSAETPSVTRRALRSLSFSSIGGQVFTGFTCTCVTVADRLYKASQMDNKGKNDKALAPHCPDHSPVMDKSVKLDTGRQFLLLESRRALFVPGCLSPQPCFKGLSIYRGDNHSNFSSWNGWLTSDGIRNEILNLLLGCSKGWTSSMSWRRCNIKYMCKKPLCIFKHDMMKVRLQLDTCCD